jgi:hypothetical protein
MIKTRILNYIICDYCKEIINNPYPRQLRCKIDKHADNEYKGCDIKANRNRKLKNTKELKNRWPNQNVTKPQL